MIKAFDIILIEKLIVAKEKTNFTIELNKYKCRRKLTIFHSKEQ